MKILEFSSQECQVWPQFCIGKDSQTAKASLKGFGASTGSPGD